MEQIYTIPVNEAFSAMLEEGVEHKCRCPFCEMHSRLEDKEVDRILGAAMMEPDVRIRTNQVGFCPTHFEEMLRGKNRLGLALILESHLDELKGKMKGGILGKSAAGIVKTLDALENSCYVCERIETAFTRMIETAVLLWERDTEFGEKFRAQTCFCLPHYRRMIAYAQAKLPKKTFARFYEEASEIENTYLDKLKEDVSWFCKKFDYRYADEPWNGAKDAPERAIAALSSEKHEDKEIKRQV
jgi:hypothetical protein